VTIGLADRECRADIDTECLGGSSVDEGDGTVVIAQKPTSANREGADLRLFFWGDAEDVDN
jgi:hypothetical protein